MRCVTRRQSLIFVPLRYKTTLYPQTPKYMIGCAITTGAISLPYKSSNNPGALPRPILVSKGVSSNNKALEQGEGDSQG